MDEDIKQRMDAWVAEIAAELQVPVPGDISSILDVAKDAAHSVARPAAPVTTFLLGYAVAQGADAGDVARVIAQRAQSFDG